MGIRPRGSGRRAESRSKFGGRKQAAIDFVTDKTELDEAVAHVKAEYNRAGGLLNMVFTLGEFEIKSDIKQWLGDRDYTRDNWAILSNT